MLVESRAGNRAITDTENSIAAHREGWRDPDRVG